MVNLFQRRLKRGGSSLGDRCGSLWKGNSRLVETHWRDHVPHKLTLWVPFVFDVYFGEVCYVCDLELKWNCVCVCAKLRAVWDGGNVVAAAEWGLPEVMRCHRVGGIDAKWLIDRLIASIYFDDICSVIWADRWVIGLFVRSRWRLMKHPFNRWQSARFQIAISHLAERFSPFTSILGPFQMNIFREIDPPGPLTSAFLSLAKHKTKKRKLKHEVFVNPTAFACSTFCVLSTALMQHRNHPAIAPSMSGDTTATNATAASSPIHIVHTN